VVVGELRDCRERQSAAQHALQPLHPTLHRAQVGSHEPGVVRKAHPLGFSRPADSPSRHPVSQPVVHVSLIIFCRINHRTFSSSSQLFDVHCCHMGTAIKHPVPDRVKPFFVIFDIRALLTLSPERQCPDVKNYK